MIQRYSDTMIQRYNDTTIQRYSDTMIQRYNDAVGFSRGVSGVGRSVSWSVDRSVAWGRSVNVTICDVEHPQKNKNQSSKHTKHSKNVFECTQDTLDHYGRKHVPKCQQKCPQKSESGRSPGPPGIKNPSLNKKKNSLNKKKKWRENKRSFAGPDFFWARFLMHFGRSFLLIKF